MYVIPRVSACSYDDLLFSLKFNPKNITDMYWDIPDPNIFKYINKTYYNSDGGAMKIEVAACTIIYHLLHNNLSPSDMSPPVPDSVAYNLELMMAILPNDYDELVDTIDDKVLQKVLQYFHDTGRNSMEKTTLKRSAAFVYLAMKQSLDFLEIEQESRLDVFRDCIDKYL